MSMSKFASRAEYEAAYESAKKPHPDAKRDNDGHCTVCGIEWPNALETDEPHLCPPGFHVRHDAASEPSGESK